MRPSKKSPSPSRDGNPPIRWELVARLRQEIAQGQYDTPERCAAAVDKLLDRWQADRPDVGPVSGQQ